jgi:omega-6 fatty acid desaturase (delta-12 desaturase)
MKREKHLKLRKAIAPYEKAETKASVSQLVNTFTPFFLLWYFAYESLAISYLLSLLFIVAAAGFLVRIFILFHDACHNSFFKNKHANNILGNITGVLTLFPFRQWRHSHNIHHATSSNLNKRGVGDIWVMTIEEYQKASARQRTAYRLYRNPFVMFVLGPLYLLLISNRKNRKGARLNERMNTYLINLAIVVLYGLMCWLIGWQAFFMIQGPIAFIAASLGIWLFYIQHHFEDTYFAKEEEWDFVKAAVEGSSFYKLPKWIQWLTGNIGYHHVHHLSPKVPNYYLQTVHEKNVELNSVPVVTFRSSLIALKYRLWDEKHKRFISFDELNKIKMSQKFVQKAID